jgi:hypothetical protein
MKTIIRGSMSSRLWGVLGARGFCCEFMWNIAVCNNLDIKPILIRPFRVYFGQRRSNNIYASCLLFKSLKSKTRACTCSVRAVCSAQHPESNESSYIKHVSQCCWTKHRITQHLQWCGLHIQRLLIDWTENNELKNVWKEQSETTDLKNYLVISRVSPLNL